MDGKAKVVREELCDGAGFCLGVCPTGALTVEEREAPAFLRKPSQRLPKAERYPIWYRNASPVIQERTR